LEEQEMGIVEDLAESLESGDSGAVTEQTQAAIDAGLGAQEILDQGLLAGMAVVGRRFKVHEIFLPDVLLAAKAMYAGLDLLKPLMVEQDVPRKGKVVLGTVQGDLHDIGKNLVGIMLEGAGFEVIDLGIDVAPETLVDTAQQQGARVLGLSAMLTTTMPVMRKVVEIVEERGLGAQIKVLVGGAPLSEAYAAEIGAAAYCFDGTNAVETVSEILGV
jgi:5-methyltetrahydrofolate--homocysteine methyltransferase